MTIARADGGPLTAEEIAQQSGAPTGYLSKILRRLTRAGILSAQRGVGGGFALVRPSRDLTALEIVTAVEGGVPRVHECPLGSCESRGLCPLHRLIDRAAADLESALATTTIADLADARLPHTPRRSRRTPLTS